MSPLPTPISGRLNALVGLDDGETSGNVGASSCVLTESLGSLNPLSREFATESLEEGLPCVRVILVNDVGVFLDVPFIRSTTPANRV